MSQNKKNILIVVKNNSINNIFLTKQTETIHDKTNLKIRELGEKYYKTKSIFERINIHRDTLYAFGKVLEEEYKLKKVGLHLQGQMKRSKEALISWYAEYFYDEICDPSTKFLERLLIIQYCNLTKNIQNSNKEKSIKQFKKAYNSNDSHKFETVDNNHLDTNINISGFNGLKFNQEIDSFQIEDNKNESKYSDQNIFQYDDLLNL